MTTTKHRLNHHDIVALDAIKARRKAEADMNRRDDSVVTIGAALCFIALAAMHIGGWLA